MEQLGVSARERLELFGPLQFLDEVNDSLSFWLAQLCPDLVGPDVHARNFLYVETHLR